MDIASISAILNSIKTATDLAKLVKDSDFSLEKAETKLKLAEIVSALADAKIEVTEIQQTLVDKNTEIRTLKEQLDVKGAMRWEKPYYWRVEGEQKDGPFCQHCYDKERELIRLQCLSEGYWECKACKNNYSDSTWEQPGGMVVGRGHDPYIGF